MNNTISPDVFGRILVDDQDDLIPYFNAQNTQTSPQKSAQIKRVNVDFPLWMVEELDRQANHLGVPRQALIKMWIAEKLQEQQAK